MNQPVIDALNNQITVERQNEVVYHALAIRLEMSNLSGLARFMRKAAAEEAGHAAAFICHLIDRGVEPVIASLDGVSISETDMLQVGAACFEQALQREIVNTDSINNLYALADEEVDAQTCVFLHRFVQEQTDSVREYTELSKQLRFATGCPAAVLAMDHELGEVA